MFQQTFYQLQYSVVSDYTHPTAVNLILFWVTVTKIHNWVGILQKFVLILLSDKEHYFEQNSTT